VDEVSELLEQVLGEQFQERGGFASGDHQAVDCVEVFDLADEDDGCAELFETAAVGVEVALKS